MVRWTPPLPAQFGDVPAGFDLFFGCSRGGCHRGKMIEVRECVRRWGQEGLIADVASRFRCEACRRRGARPELRRRAISLRPTKPAPRPPSAVDSLVRAISDVRPQGTVN